MWIIKTKTASQLYTGAVHRDIWKLLNCFLGTKHFLTLLRDTLTGRLNHCLGGEGRVLLKNNPLSVFY